MLPEKIKLIKPVFTFIKNPKNKESLRLLLLLPVFLFLILPHGAAASSNWELTPQNPVVGDTMEIKGTGFEGDTAKVLVSFEKDVEVQDGEYEYLLEDVVIPSGFDNSFTVQAVGADDLNVRAKLLLWLTKGAEAKDGVATVSHTNVPPGTYEIRIDGKANGSSVKLKITAMQEIEVDSDGNLSYEYNTKSIPAGNFEVNVEGITKQIELQPSENLPSETNSSEQNLSEEQNNESLPSEMNYSEQNSTEGTDDESPGDTSEVKAYNWTDSQGNESITPEIKTEKNSWNNMMFILSYPYSLRSFYTVNESIKLSYYGPEALGQQNVDIYLIKEHSPSSPENGISGLNESTIRLEDVLNNDTEAYARIPATLNKNGDLSPLTLGPLQAGSYWTLITLAGNETEKTGSEKEILLAKYFEVLKYQMEARVPYTIQEGENVEVNLDLQNAPDKDNYTYWTVLIKDGAYTASKGTKSIWMTTKIRPIVNGVDLIRSLETNLSGYESENEKDELKNEIQTLIGKDNGTISIGEKNQSNLSLKSLELPPGDYLLLSGAYENNEGLAGISQKKLRISPENSYGLDLKSISGKYLQKYILDEIKNLSAYGN
ncbi:TIGR04279 domain-containing protein [Methanosarcina sp. DH1]|uniref:TIGR04279 domain-containing protein n=1 Tax=Methanosarcina sp. DH1 TaxID=2605695 RepID=UPI001E3D1D09|nr:TIGR04279 domain-containing protein [Methanosarcina sp. DH1]MCC4767893.1 TIGR04279 domain-containing protein [Methanosarcina sp. DH1]